MSPSDFPGNVFPQVTAVTIDNVLMVQQNNYGAEEVRSDQFIDILNGTDLFSYFTADIIKLEAVFTR